MLFLVCCPFAEVWACEVWAPSKVHSLCLVLQHCIKKKIKGWGGGDLYKSKSSSLGKGSYGT